MITPQQMVERILREERMSPTSNPWWNNVAYSGTAPSDLTDERNRPFYEAIKSVDRDLRMELHRTAPRMLLERATFSVGPTEKPFPVQNMRYIEIVLDSLGRRVPVVSFGAQPELTLARCRALGYPTPLKEAPFRVVITRPGYWKVSPTTSAQTLTVSFIREHGFLDKPIWYDDAPTDSKLHVPAAPVGLAVTGDPADWCETLFPATDTIGVGASTRFDFVSDPAAYLFGYIDVANSLPMTRAGYNLEFWVKTSFGTIPETVQIILSKSATCLTLEHVGAAVGISLGNEWYRWSVPTPSLSAILTIGFKINTTPVVAGRFWIDRMVYTQPMGSIPFLGSSDYLEDLLLSAVRARLNETIRPEVSAQLSARVKEKLLSFAMNDGAGERPRRLRVKVPR